MSDTRTDLSQPLKWVSAKGTLLGTFTMPPDRTANLLDLPSWRVMDFVYLDRPLIVAFHSMDEMVNNMVNYHRVSIRRCNWPEHPDGFHIYGIGPEQWEKIPGHTFSPSAAYIRSLMSEGPIEPR